MTQININNNNNIINSNVQFDELQRQLKDAVCYFTLANGTFIGTGFHFENGWILTNSHVAFEFQSETNFKIVFPHHTFCSQRQIFRNQRTIMSQDFDVNSTERFKQLDGSLPDLAAIHLSDTELSDYFKTNGKSLPSLTSLGLTEHTGTLDAIKGLNGKIIRYRVDGTQRISDAKIYPTVSWEIQVDCKDTEPGSSGSPVLTSDFQHVLGMYLGGPEVPVPGTTKKGVKIAVVLQFMEAVKTLGKNVNRSLFKLHYFYI